MNNPIQIIPFSKELIPHFKAMNVAWLEKYFSVEPIDEKIFANPEAYILEPGGHIFFATYNGKIAGTCALIKGDDGFFEVAKMAVDETFQGRGIGHKLMEAVIQKANELRLPKLILYTNALLQPAIHLYKKFGFIEVPLTKTGYKRSGLKMEKNLEVETMHSVGKKPSRIGQLFARKNKNILNVYCTAGYPNLNSTLEVMGALQSAGADLIELGMPYSDPLADGPVIQASGLQALQNGMTIATLFSQLKDFRNTISVPVVLMGYLNPVLQYGFEAFCEKAAEVGIDGLIIPDIPVYEYEAFYKPMVKKHGLDFIFLITPETSESRIKKLDSESSGFLYAVSSSSITGSDKDFSPVEAYLKRLQGMSLKNPVLVGFGIKDKYTFDAACKYAAGAIIGTAYIKALESSSSIKESTTAFLDGILANKNAVLI